MGAKKVFVVSNNSSRKFLEGECKLIEALKADGVLASPLNSSVGMGGAEKGLLVACDEAYKCGADCVVTVGGGGVQDAGKFIRLWLTTQKNNDAGKEGKKSTVPDLLAAQKQDPMPILPPQIACPNSFSMAEATYVAGIETSAKTKSGAASPILIPTTVVYDPALSKGLPDWVRFGTAFRGVEHAMGAVCHPKADDDIRERALRGLELLKDGIDAMIQDPDSEEAQSNVYLGGWTSIRALNTGKFSYFLVIVKLVFSLLIYHFFFYFLCRLLSRLGPLDSKSLLRKIWCPSRILLRNLMRPNIVLSLFRIQILPRSYFCHIGRRNNTCLLYSHQTRQSVTWSCQGSQRSRCNS